MQVFSTWLKEEKTNKHRPAGIWPRFDLEKICRATGSQSTATFMVSTGPLGSSWHLGDTTRAACPVVICLNIGIHGYRLLGAIFFHPWNSRMVTCIRKWASVNIMVSSKWVKYQFGVNSPFKPNANKAATPLGCRGAVRAALFFPWGGFIFKRRSV